MAWWRGDDRSHGNSKLLAVGLDGTGLYFRMVSWCSAHESDGRIPEHVIPTLCPGLGKSAIQTIIRKLLTKFQGESAALLEKTDEGFFIRDYLDYNPSHAYLEGRREKERQRIEGKRAGVASGSDSQADEVLHATPSQVASVLNDPGPSRPLLKTPLTPTSGGTDASHLEAKPKLTPRALGQNPRAVSAAVEAATAPARAAEHAVRMAWTFGETRARQGIYASEAEARDEFESKYRADPGLAAAAIEGWCTVHNAAAEPVSA